MIIRKVWQNNTTKQLLVTVPQENGIVNGDYVEITKVVSSKEVDK